MAHSLLFCNRQLRITQRTCGQIVLGGRERCSHQLLADEIMWKVPREAYCYLNLSETLEDSGIVLTPQKCAVDSRRDSRMQLTLRKYPAWAAD
ncbi:MAG: hypothetical protein ROO76_23890 [Terriglobia bacterium]|nr:hypothetical protein [Terriglobia bacterium]